MCTVPPHYRLHRFNLNREGRCMLSSTTPFSDVMLHALNVPPPQIRTGKTISTNHAAWSLAEVHCIPPCLRPYSSHLLPGSFHNRLPCVQVQSQQRREMYVTQHHTISRCNNLVTKYKLHVLNVPPPQIWASKMIMVNLAMHSLA